MNLMENMGLTPKENKREIKLKGRQLKRSGTRWPRCWETAGRG